MSCGCGDPTVEKPDQITQQDLEGAAQAQGKSVDEVVQNIQKTHSSTG
ncbi:MAG: hypothetical protein M3493_10235 [Actinomycetota bacterium]|jgi:hypothetical protein|nr:hypothetical protein [Actinomycetota bacterium]